MNDTSSLEQNKPPVKINWRDSWRLIKPYWVSEDKWKARGLLAAIIALTLFAVYLNVLFNSWNRDFYNALETKNYVQFQAQLWRFSYLAFIFIAVAIYRIYLRQALEIRWRAWMTHHYLSKWLANQAYYRIEQTHTADNPDQRIAEDLNLLTSGTLSLSLGFLSSVVSLVSFVGILWSVSGPLSFLVSGHHVTIPGYMVWFAIAYAGIGSWIVWKTAKPLIQQNFNQQRFEADFRFGLVRIREYAEPIAMYSGEIQERAHLDSRFDRIRQNWWAIMVTTKRLNIASNFYAQFAIIFPMLVGAPRYFSGAITLGGLTQISSAFGQVQDALSWFIDAFTSLAEWKASINRLAGFHASVMQAEASEAKAGLVTRGNTEDTISLENLSLQLPSGQWLAGPVSMKLLPAQRILVTGASGSGKSTLFRAIAGIWPYGSGAIQLPQNRKIFFLPQRTYLPIGSLRAAIAYPAAENTYADDDIRHYLRLCHLDALGGKLDEVDNWGQRLSAGEQQRLAFIRIFLTRPDVVFLDEATSALDGDMEQTLYELLVRTLPQASLLSIAHRNTVAKFHDTQWQFNDGNITANAL